MRMPTRDPGLLAVLLAWFQEHWPTLYGLALSVVIAWLRMARSGSTKRQRALEAALCGAISLSVMSGLEWFGVPGTASGFIGGSIGFLGVERIRDLADGILERRLNSGE